MKLIRLLSGPLAAFFIWFCTDLQPGKPAVTLMAGVVIWVALWWLTEVIDLAVTSFLPLILLPALGLMDIKEVAAQYMEQIIFLFIGGFILSFAMEKWDLHKRLSLWILQLIGDNPARILAGVMMVTFFISMWMSNTATVLMLYPAVLAVQQHISQENTSGGKKIGIALLLGLAYSASIGGMATLVGTPTNMIFYSFFIQNYPQNTSLTFGSWFAIAAPISLCLLLATYLLLRYRFIGKAENQPFDKQYFQSAYQRLGAFSYEEKWVTFLFVTTASLWFSRADMDLGFVQIPGWSRLFPNPKWIQDSSVAMFMAMLLFFIPAKNTKQVAKNEDFGEDAEGGILGNTLLAWEDVRKLPFGIIMLFGAGFALSKGFEVSGLSIWLADKLEFLKFGHPILIIAGICTIICIISEFASNVASIQLTLPILMILQQHLGVDPLLLMIPATLAASLGFMLPVATAPNTIVFSSRMIPVSAMTKAGFWVDLVGIILISSLAYGLGKVFIG